MKALFLLPTVAAAFFGMLLGLAAQRSRGRGIPVPPLGRSVARLGGTTLSFGLVALAAGIYLPDPLKFEGAEIPLLGIFITGPMGAFLGLVVYLWVVEKRERKPSDSR